MRSRGTRPRWVELRPAHRTSRDGGSPSPPPRLAPGDEEAPPCSHALFSAAGPHLRPTENRFYAFVVSQRGAYLMLFRLQQKKSISSSVGATFP